MDKPPGFTKIEVEIVDTLFKINNTTYPQTAKVKFLNGDIEAGNKNYGYIPIDELYKTIDYRTRRIMLDYCYIKDFSLTDYRKLRNIENNKEVDLCNFSARHSLFHSETITDFSFAHFDNHATGFDNSVFVNQGTSFVHTQFGDGDDNFEKCIFLNGDVNFYQAKFGCGDVSFKSAVFGNGKKVFEKVDFGEGELNFMNVDFGNGDLYFNNIQTQSGRVGFNSAHFGNGRKNFSNIRLGIGELFFEKATFGEGEITFRSAVLNEGKVDFTNAAFSDAKLDFSHTDFGNGNITFLRAEFMQIKMSFKLTVIGNGKLDFHFAKFKKADIIFERTMFGNGLFDFRAAEIQKGNIRFHKSVFGDGNADFEAIEMKDGKIQFIDCSFGKGDFKFESARCLGAKVTFEDIDFGGKDLWFKLGEFGELTIKSCQLNDFVDLRVNRCNSLSIVDCIVRDILDMRTDISPVTLGKLDLSAMRLLGRIYIDWHGSNIKELIYNQQAGYAVKSEQFRMLKQNFNTTGNYAEEDEAYVEFKRTESKAIRKSIIDNAKKYYNSGIKTFLLYFAIKKEKNIDENTRQHLISIIKKENLSVVDSFYDMDFLIRRNISFDKEKVKPYIETIKNIKIEEKIKKRPLFLQILIGLPYISRVIFANLSYWGQKIVFDKVGLYATNPVRVLMSMFVVYFTYSLIYLLLPYIEGTDIITTVFADNDPNNLTNVGRAFYLSAITFLTIGYGDFVPIGFNRVIAGIEGFTGVFLMSYFTVAFVRKILR